MDSLEYQKTLAELDEKIAFHKARAEQIEHEKARFVLDVLTATFEAKRASALPGNTEVTKGPQGAG